MIGTIEGLHLAMIAGAAVWTLLCLVIGFVVGHDLGTERGRNERRP